MADLSLSNQTKLFLLSRFGWALVWLLGSLLRYRVEGWEHVERLKKAGSPAILSFWHNQIFYATHFWRFRNISVITSPHADGDYIAHIIERFGYSTARGSSTRGSTGALLELKRHLRKGGDVAFTIDGPRGPVYQVKPGPVWLSQKTGHPIVPFHIQPKSFWQTRSWDGFRIPKPFSPALVKIGPPFTVPPGDSGENWVHTYQRRMDALKEYCEAYDWEGSGVGSGRSP